MADPPGRCDQWRAVAGNGIRHVATSELQETDRHPVRHRSRGYREVVREWVRSSPMARLGCANREGMVMPQRRKTTTSNFGVSTRESHDSTPFYDRFRAPELSSDDTIPPPVRVAQPYVHGDARHMDQVEDGPVALVLPSPPYFAG